MILADTSVWVDHLRSGNDALFELLERGEILIHPFVLGELMLGGLSGEVLADLRLLPAAPVATVDEVETLINVSSLSGRGIGYVDVALIAACRVLPGARLWTLDKRLAAVVEPTDLALRVSDSGAVT